MLELDLEELAEYTGQDGKPVYVAYEGKIYDVSGSKLWKTGTHMKRHQSGKNLTVDMGGAPHGPEVLERYPQVGVIRQPKSPMEQTTFLEPLFKRHPFLRRHPHPMTVHFPIAFILAATFFTILYLITGDASFEATAFHCLGAGLVFIPLVILTGVTSWWVNYMAKPMKPVTIKMVTSFPLFVVSLCAFAWRASTPDIILNFRASSVIYLLLILSLSPMVGVIGWYGAKLTFPIEKS